MPKTYYWLKLSFEFFRSKEVKKLNRQAGGDKYVIIYLQMLLLSLDCGGMIYYDGIEDNIVDEIALALDLYDNDVRVVFEYLLKVGLAVELDGGAYFFPQAVAMTGKESDSAERKRRQRAREAEKLLAEASERDNVTPERDNVTPKRDNVQNCHTEKDIDIESEKELELDIDIDNNNDQNAQKKETYAEAFDKLWESYPRKIGKKRAFEAYKRAIKSGTTDEVIADGIERYRQYVESRKFEEKYIKQGSTWFAGECWNDEYDISARQLTAEEERDYQELWGG